jgi:hypothetical protein
MYLFVSIWRTDISHKWTPRKPLVTPVKQGQLSVNRRWRAIVPTNNVAYCPHPKAFASSVSTPSKNWQVRSIPLITTKSLLTMLDRKSIGQGRGRVSIQSSQLHFFIQRALMYKRLKKNSRASAIKTDVDHICRAARDGGFSKFETTPCGGALAGMYASACSISGVRLLISRVWMSIVAIHSLMSLKRCD